MKYIIEKAMVEMVKSSRKLETEQLLIQLPSKADTKTMGDKTRGIGGIVKTSKKGEQLCIPLLLTELEGAEEPIRRVVMKASEFYRAIDMATLTAEDVTIIIKNGKAEISGGTTKTVVGYTPADKVLAPITIQTEEPPIAVIKLKSEALLKRLEMVKTFATEKRFIDFREIDGSLYLLPPLNDCIIAVSQFSDSEWERQGDTPISWPMDMRYIPMIESMKLANDAMITIYQNGFKLTSGGSTLLGSCLEIKGLTRYPDKAVAVVQKSANANFDAKFTLEDKKLVTGLLNLWERDLTSRNLNIKNICVKIDTSGGTLSMEATDLLSYAPTAKLLANKPGVYYVAKNFFNQMLNISNPYIGIAGQNDTTVLFATGTEKDDETGKVTQTGDYILVMGVKPEGYEEMRTMVTSAASKSTDAGTEETEEEIDTEAAEETDAEE